MLPGNMVQWEYKVSDAAGWQSEWLLMESHVYPRWASTFSKAVYGNIHAVLKSRQSVIMMILLYMLFVWLECIRQCISHYAISCWQGGMSRWHICASASSVPSNPYGG